ncbi:MAG: hypothetical protein ACO2Z9_02620 [Crocinitomicaceae bacterium]
MIRFLAIALIVWTSSNVIGQELNSHISQTTVSIGQAFEVKYQLSSDSLTKVFFKAFDSEIPVLEKTDSSVLSSDSKTIEILNPFQDTSFANNWVGRYTVTAWDSGLFIIPGPKIVFQDSTYQFDDLAFQCLLVSKKQDVDLYDIRENFTELPPKPFKFFDFLINWWWAILIILITLIFLLWKSRKPKVVEVKKEISLKDRTLFAIDSLEEAKLWEKDRLKDHFVELSYIMRRYLSARYSDSLMEKTTEEIKFYLIHRGLERDTIETITTILSSSDMVKFAKSEPDLISILKFSNLARQIVTETSPLEFDTDE